MASTRPQMPSRSAGTPRVNMLLRGLAVLEEVATVSGRRGTSVSDVASATGLDRSTASRILAFLRDAGYVRQDIYRRYRLSSKLGRLAANYSTNDDLLWTARPYIEKLHDDWGEEIHLAVRDGDDMVFIDYIGSSQLVRSNLSLTPRAIHLSAAGRALLAYLPDRERERTITELTRRELEPLLSKQVAPLLSDLESARKAGWAGYDPGDGVARFAAPIFGDDEVPIAAMSISGPEFRLRDSTAKLATAVMDAARRTTDDLRTDHREDPPRR